MPWRDYYQERSKDIADYNERGIYGDIQYVDGAGAIMRVRGTGNTEDLEVPVVNTGFSFNLPKDYNAEVMMISFGSDTNQKYALPMIPRDKQRKWPVNTGGIQHPTNPDRYIEINEKRTHLKDGAYAFGAGGEFEINGNQVVIRGNLTVAGNLNVNGAVNFAVGGRSEPIVSGATTTPIGGFSA